MVNPILSILILTHNRPELFKRCLNSVISENSESIEIIVNNDSCDVEELHNDKVKYFYKKFNNISQIYEFLFSHSKGKYIYFLEDDDYLKQNFLDQDFDSDIIAGNYCPTYKPNDILKIMNIFKDEIVYDSSEFTSKLNLEHLQLGQFIFNRSVIEDFIFGTDNNIHNDIRLVYHAASKSTKFRTTNKVFYYQTKDGNDNISFPNTKKNIKVTASMNFLKEYEIQNTTS